MAIDTLITTRTLIQEVRERTDYPDAKGTGLVFPGDEWLEREIRRSIVKLWDFLHSTFGPDFWHTTATITTVAGTRDYDLPADLWRFKRVDAALNGSQARFPFRRISLATDRLHDTSYSWGVGRDVGYYLNLKRPGGAAGTASQVFSQIGFDPIPSGEYTVTIYYVPAPDEFQVEETKFWNLLGYEEFVILDMALKVRQKDEGDPQLFMAAMQECRQSIQNDAPPLDVGQPNYIADVRSNGVGASDDSEGWFNR